MPSPGPDGLIEPEIDEVKPHDRMSQPKKMMLVFMQYGVIMTEDDHEWIEGTGQKIVLSCGQFSWGQWSERRQTYTYPKVGWFLEFVFKSPLGYGDC
jgi:hypothetical protein